MATIEPIIRKAQKLKKASVTFKVDPAMADDLEKLRQRVKSRREKVEFNFDMALQHALAKVIKQSNKALDAIDESERESPGIGVVGERPED